MATCVLDTSICVDLWNGGILELVMRLPHKFLLPDVIAEECEEPPGELLLSMGFTSVSLDAQEIELVTEYGSRFGQLSVKDCFALAYSKIHNHILLTGDKSLRIAAEKEQVHPHGVLWLLDEIVSKNILSGPEAIDALNKMRDTGSWLPAEECEKRIRRWSDQSHE